MADNKYPKNMDKECISLCEAINNVPGLHTIESCCGHGKEPFRIWFHVEFPDDLPVLLYYCDPCHVGFTWRCTVSTDCAMSPVHFMLESEAVGEEAYKQSETIADHVNSSFEMVDEEPND